MISTDEGITIFLRRLWKNVYSRIICIEEGSMTLVNLHQLNALRPIDLTVEGISMDSILQPLNALAPIESSPSDSFTVVKQSEPSNASSPISTTLLGITTSVTLLLSL